MKLPQLVSKTTSEAVGAFAFGALSSTFLGAGRSTSLHALAAAPVLVEPPPPHPDTTSAAIASGGSRSWARREAIKGVGFAALSVTGCEHGAVSGADAETPITEPDSGAGPPARIRLIGRALNATIARAPWLWPLLRRPVASYFDELAGGWDERSGAPGPRHLAPLAVAVTKIDRRPERALDIGTGTGVAALFLAREFPHASVRGIDVSEEMIRQAKAKVGLDPEGRVAFRVADASELPWAEDHFDLVTQLNMPPFFAETARVLRHGGHVIVAASSGDRTPFYTPDAVLERGFARQGFETVNAGRIGSGSYFVARKGR